MKKNLNVITREKWLRHAVEMLDTKLFNGDLDLFNRQYQVSVGRCPGQKMSESVFPFDGEDVSLDDGSIKRLQKVHVMYNNPDNTFEGKNMYMDPVIDKDGNNITRESYLELLSQNKPLVKGFFAIDQVEKQPTNYIGHIGYNREGKPIRGKDTNFERAYKGHLDRKKLREYKERESRFNKQLQEQVNNAPFHDDTKNQPEDLSKDTYIDPYNHLRSSNNDFTR